MCDFIRQTYDRVYEGAEQTAIGALVSYAMKTGEFPRPDYYDRTNHIHIILYAEGKCIRCMQAYTLTISDTQNHQSPFPWLLHKICVGPGIDCAI